MLILKIKDKGMYLEIPGTLPTRSPAEIDISKCDLISVSTYLRKQGIKNYQILSLSGDDAKIRRGLPAPKMQDASIDQKVINKRFTRLEEMVEQLLQKQVGNDDQKSEQITDKLKNLEELAKKLLDKEPVIQRVVEVSSKSQPKTKKKPEPKIEELEDTFIPSIDVSNMKMKGGSKKTIKQDKMDLDDSADLLSRIMGQDD